jgi:two-component system, cell cycle sensor histidine kinase and response regulator CckA
MGYRLQDLIDVPKVQELLDSLNDAFAFATAVIDNESNVLTASGWQEICALFHRANPAIERQCRESDRHILQQMHEGKPSVTYSCPMGLIDCATPIVIGGQHLGNVFIGQLFLEKPDPEQYRERAREYGFTEEAYLATLAKVPVLTKEQLERNLAFIRKFTELLGEMGLERLKEFENEQRFRTIFDSANDAILICDLAIGKNLDANQRFCELYGYTREEARQLTIADLISGDTSYTLKNALARMKKAAAGKPQTFEWQTRDKSGRFFWVEVNLRRVTIAGGERLLVTARDVTERKQAAEALRESMERYRSLVENVDLGITLVDSNHQIVMANAAFGRWFNKPAGEFMRKECFREFEKRTSVCLHCPGTVAMQSGKKATVDTRGVREDGSEFEVRINAFPVFDVAGKATQFIEVVEDITERRAAEEEVKNTLSLLSATLEATADGILVRDTAGRIITYNQKFADMWRFPAAVLLTRDDRQMRAFVLDQLKDPERFLAITEKQYVLLEDESCDILEFKDGRIFERVSRPQRIEGKIVGRVTSFREVTEHRRLEDQLRQSQKLESIGTLAGGVAHDFNNILTTIIGHANLLQMRMGENNLLRSNVDQILSASERAANLTQSLLAYSRKQISKPVPVELNAVIRGFEILLRQVIPESIDFRNSLATDGLTIMADSGQLEQVLMNLVTNARDAMPQGGHLFVGTQPVTIDHEFVHAHGFGKPGYYALLSVTDNGSGMDKRTRQRIFEPFFTTKEVGKGTGLGLAMVYGIVKQHDGFINVYSEPGQGTTFRIYLPLIDSAVQQPENLEIRPLKTGSETILLVEDDGDLRQLLQEVLESGGYGVIEAVDGEDGIARFIEHKEDIHLVLSDVMMPGKNGKEAFDRMREIRDNIRVLFISGYPAAATREILDEELDYLSKPVFPRELLLKIREVLDK